MRTVQGRNFAFVHLLDHMAEDVGVQLVDMQVGIADGLGRLEITLLIGGHHIIDHRRDHGADLDHLVPRQLPRLALHDRPGAFADIAGIVADPLKALGRLGGRQDAAQIVGTRRANRDDHQHSLVDLGLQLVEFPVAVDQHLDPLFLEIRHRAQAAIQLLAGKHAEAHKRPVQLNKVSFESAACMCCLVHNLAFLQLRSC